MICKDTDLENVFTELHATHPLSPMSIQVHIQTYQRRLAHIRFFGEMF
jgi:hypothetical protein